MKAKQKIEGSSVGSALMLGIIIFLLTIYDKTFIMSTAYYRMMEIIMLGIIIFEIRRSK
jgi:hypothetical protein